MCMLICVCGDSFFSSDPKLPGTHWHELLKLDKNIKIKDLSTTGASNLAIRLQVKYAVNVLKADGIILTATTVSRIDLRLSKLNYYYNQETSFKKSVTDSNKLYDSFYDFKQPQRTDWIFKSNTLKGIQQDNEKYGTKEFQKLFEEFYYLFFDEELDIEKDFCIIQHTLNEYNNKIMLFDPRDFDKLNFDRNKIINLTNRFPFRMDTIYHTTIEQQKILAAEVQQRLKELYNI